jgi:hypothetical protein
MSNDINNPGLKLNRPNYGAHQLNKEVKAHRTGKTEENLTNYVKNVNSGIISSMHSKPDYQSLTSSHLKSLPEDITYFKASLGDIRNEMNKVSQDISGLHSGNSEISLMLDTLKSIDKIKTFKESADLTKKENVKELKDLFKETTDNVRSYLKSPSYLHMSSRNLSFEDFTITTSLDSADYATKIIKSMLQEVENKVPLNSKANKNSGFADGFKNNKKGTSKSSKSKTDQTKLSKGQVISLKKSFFDKLTTGFKDKKLSFEFMKFMLKSTELEKLPEILDKFVPNKPLSKAEIKSIFRNIENTMTKVWLKNQKLEHKNPGAYKSEYQAKPLGNYKTELLIADLNHDLSASLNDQEPALAKELADTNLSEKNQAAFEDLTQFAKTQSLKSFSAKDIAKLSPFKDLGVNEYEFMNNALSNLPLLGNKKTRMLEYDNANSNENKALDISLTSENRTSAEIYKKNNMDPALSLGELNEARVKTAAMSLLKAGTVKAVYEPNRFQALDHQKIDLILKVANPDDKNSDFIMPVQIKSHKVDESKLPANVLLIKTDDKKLSTGASNLTQELETKLETFKANYDSNWQASRLNPKAFAERLDSKFTTPGFHKFPDTQASAAFEKELTQSLHQKS